MLAIEKWGSGRALPLVMLSQIVAINAKSTLDLIENSRRKLLLSQKVAAGRQPATWHSCYRKPFSVEAAVISAIQLSEGGNSDQQESLAWSEVRRFAIPTFFQEGVRDWLKGSFTERELRIGKGLVERYYKRTHLPRMRQMLRDECPTIGNPEKVLAKPEILFSLAVVFPSWILFRKTAWELYLAARRGDFVAFENLARLDPSVLHEPRLSVQAVQMSFQRPSQYELLLHAAERGITEKMTLAKVKFLLGGFLCSIAERMDWCAKREPLYEAVLQCIEPGYERQVRAWVKKERRKMERVRTGFRLTAMDIRGLFDAVAQDKSTGRVDPDFDQRPNSIYQRLARNRWTINDLQQSDIRRAA